MRRVFILILVVGAFLVTERLCHRATEGFALNKIRYPLMEELVQTLEKPSIQRHYAENILKSQSFNYLGSGAQCYAFLSEDKQYVLKLFKFQHMRIPPWLKSIPLPQVFEKKRSAKLLKKRRIIDEIFTSFEIAHRQLQDETGLIMLHLNKTADLKGVVKIIDRTQNEYELDLDTNYFVLQRYATLAYDQIDQWIEDGNISEARRGIRSLVKLAYKRCKKGVFDKDPNFRTNFGFVNGKAQQIDIGRFSHNDREKKPEIYAPEIVRITREFRTWLEDHHEALVEVLDEEVAKITTKVDN